MASWGTPYGTCSLWGVGVCQDDICDDADGRVLVQMDDTTGNRTFRDMQCDYASSVGHYIDVCQDVQAGFDVNTAIGAQLDIIGSIVGLPRQGYGDTDYRRFLKIQSDILLAQAREDANWTGTSNNLLTICRTFIGTGVATPVVLNNTPPYEYTLSVPGVSIADMQVLAGFLCVATYAGVRGLVYFSQGADSSYGSVHGAATDEGIYGSVHGVVAGAAVYGGVVVIGEGAC